MGNPIVEIRRSYDRLISAMGFPLLVRRHLYIESGPSLYNVAKLHVATCCRPKWDCKWAPFCGRVNTSLWFQGLRGKILQLSVADICILKRDDGIALTKWQPRLALWWCVVIDGHYRCNTPCDDCWRKVWWQINTVICRAISAMSKSWIEYRMRWRNIS